MAISLDNWVPKAGEVKKLIRGETYTLSDVKKITVPNLRITADPGTSGPWPIVQFTTRYPDPNQPNGSLGKPAFSVLGSASGIVINEIHFDGGTTKNTLADFQDTTGVTFTNINVLKGGGPGTLLGAQNVFLSDITMSARVRKYGMMMFRSASGRKVRNVTMKRFRCPFGSELEHCIRMHDVEDFIADDVFLDNVASPQNKQALNVRNGKNITFKNTKVMGSSIIGPLEVQIEANLRLENFKLLNSTIRGKFNMLEAGLVNALFQDVCVVGTNNQGGFNVEPELPIVINGVVRDIRPKATATFRRVSVTGNDRFITGRHAGITIAEGNTLNGNPFT